MKICVISFDHWEFDRHIVHELNSRQGVTATHINLKNFKYKYPGILQRLENSFNKIVYGKNIKVLKRQEYVLQQLHNTGYQDIILVIRPDLLDKQTHLAIKKHTRNYFAYLYDSTKRFPVTGLLDGIFNRIYSFDFIDVKQYGFIHLPNYIYLPKQPLKQSGFTHDAFMVLSADERLATVNHIAAVLDAQDVSFKFIVRASSKPSGLHKKITFSQQEIRPAELSDYLDSTKIFADIIRHGHNGLSFRVFESLAFQRKLITTNASVKNYDFYNPENILVINPDDVVIHKSFFTTPYVPLPDDIYNKYTISHWADTVFFN